MLTNSRKKYDDEEEGLLDGPVYSFYKYGVEISTLKNKIIKNIFFFSKVCENKYFEYENNLPFDINFRMSRSEVREKLGNPDWSREEYKTMLGVAPPLDNYIVKNKKYSIEYLPDCSGVRLVCVSSKI